MSTVVLFARLGLAVEFALAGAAKLADLAGSRRATRALGVPVALAGTVGTLLPLAEPAVAGSLIGSGLAVGGAFGALILLGGFVVGIAAALGRGRRPDCHCCGPGARPMLSLAPRSESIRPGWSLRNGTPCNRRDACRS